MSVDETAAYMQALSGMVHEAASLGVDVHKLCQNVKSGLVDSQKPYRWVSADKVMLAHKAIDKALESYEKYGS